MILFTLGVLVFVVFVAFWMGATCKDDAERAMDDREQARALAAGEGRRACEP